MNPKRVPKATFFNLLILTFLIILLFFIVRFFWYNIRKIQNPLLDSKIKKELDQTKLDQVYQQLKKARLPAPERSDGGQVD